MIDPSFLFAIPATGALVFAGVHIWRDGYSVPPMANTASIYGPWGPHDYDPNCSCAMCKRRPIMEKELLYTLPTEWVDKVSAAFDAAPDKMSFSPIDVFDPPRTDGVAYATGGGHNHGVLRPDGAFHWGPAVCGCNECLKLAKTRNEQESVARMFNRPGGMGPGVGYSPGGMSTEINHQGHGIVNSVGDTAHRQCPECLKTKIRQLERTVRPTIGPASTYVPCPGRTSPFGTTPPVHDYDGYCCKTWAMR